MNRKNISQEGQKNTSLDGNIQLNTDIADFRELTRKEKTMRNRRSHLMMQERMDMERERVYSSLIKDKEDTETELVEAEDIVQEKTEKKREKTFRKKSESSEKMPVEKLHPIPQQKHEWWDRIVFMVKFTGIWLSFILMVLYRILLYLTTEFKPNSLLDLICLVPAGQISFQNVLNLISGERIFTWLSPFDPKMRNERCLPVRERKELRPAPNDRLLLSGNPGFLFGKYAGEYVGKRQTEDGHIICIGAPGSGKSTAVAIPALYMWTGAVFAIDIKGELVENSQYRYNTCVFDPYDDNSFGYDPYEILRTSRPDEFVNALNDILFAIIPEKNTDDPFWDMSARRFLAGAYTWAYYNYMSFVEINEKIYRTSTDTLVSEIMSSNCKEARAYMAHFRELNEKTKSSVMENVLNAIELFATDTTIKRALLRQKTIKPEMLLQGNRIFLNIPERRLVNWRPLKAMIVNQFFRGMMGFPEKTNLKTLILLDEFPQLGKSRAVIDGMATLRSKGCTVCLLMQSYSQLDKVYGHDDRRIITDNASYKLILSAMDPTTAEEISKMVGQHYRTDITINDSGFMGGKITRGTSRRLSYIIRPEELQNLDREILLLSPYGFSRIEKTYYYKEGFKR